MRRPSVVAAALVLVALSPLWNLATNTIKVSDGAAPWILAVAVSLGIVATLIEVRNQTEVRTRSGGLAGGISLDEAAGQLAMAVGAQWRREEERRRVHDPFPLPVRWRNAHEALIDHPENYRCVPAGTATEPLDLTGQLDQIAEIYKGIRSKRLVILGKAGSGKTILAARLLLELLDIRTAADPVPVSFSLGSWNPTTTSLRDWLADQMIRDYPGLAAPSPSAGSLAAALVGADRILPILDGFDEIAEGLHRAALEALNTTRLPLVLTSRPDEYGTAVNGTDVLTGAAGIELTDLELIDLVNYLPRTTRKATSTSTTTVTVWSPVLDELHGNPHSPAGFNLAAVLTTPLMVALARTIYSDTPDHDPSELLDTDRFATPEAVEEHLLSTFIPTVYRQQAEGRRQWDPERVQHWLAYLARHLDRLGTRNLAWWQLGNTVHPAFRIFVVGLMVWLTFGLVDGLVIAFVAGWGLWGGLLRGLMFGLVVGLIFGLGHGFIGRFGKGAFEPSRARIQILGRTATVRKRFVHRFMLGLAGGLVGALALELVSSQVFGLSVNLMAGLEPWFVSWLVFGLLIGLGFGLMSALEAPIDIRSATSPSDLLNTNRMTVFFHLLAFWLVIGFGGGLVVGFASDLGDGLIFCLVAGLATGLAGGLSVTAWGRWMALARVWLPLTGRLPWPVLAFLDDAYQRGVLRQAGAVYQFRHARLQDHLNHVSECRSFGGLNPRIRSIPISKSDRNRP